MRFQAHLFTGALALACVSYVGAASAGPLTVSDARIEGGQLVVTGMAPHANQQVKLDSQFMVVSTGAKAFTFSLDYYHPADCVVEVKAGAKTAHAVVANCGPGVSPRGAWLSSKNYLADDLVQFQGSTWRALRASANKPPASNPLDWELFAAKGDTGPKGATGAHGPKGDTGARGPQGPQGAQGPEGAQGPQGVQGLSGLVAVKTFEGNAGSTILSSASWVFRGPTTTVTLPGSQRVTVGASLPVRLASGTTVQPLNYDVCYRGTGIGQTVTAFHDDFFQTAGVGTADTVLAVFASRTLTAGSYEIGFCTQHNHATGFSVDYVNGWAMVTN